MRTTTPGPTAVLFGSPRGPYLSCLLLSETCGLKAWGLK